MILSSISVVAFLSFGSSTCCLTVLVSHSSRCPDTGPETRASPSEWAAWAAAEQTNDVPLGLQASDRILDTQDAQSGTACLLRNYNPGALWAGPEINTRPRAKCGWILQLAGKTVNLPATLAGSQWELSDSLVVVFLHLFFFLVHHFVGF